MQGFSRLCREWAAVRYNPTLFSGTLFRSFPESCRAFSRVHSTRAYVVPGPRGLEFTLAMGVERLRAYGLKQLDALRGYMTDAGVNTVKGGDEDHGAFLAIRLAKAMDFATGLQREGIICDARGQWLRLCPDCLTRDEELRCAAAALGRLLRIEIGKYKPTRY